MLGIGVGLGVDQRGGGNGVLDSGEWYRQTDRQVLSATTRSSITSEACS